LNRFVLPESFRLSATFFAALGVAGGVGVLWNLWDWRAHRARSLALGELTEEPANLA